LLLPPLLEPALELISAKLRFHPAHHLHVVVGARAGAQIKHTTQPSPFGVAGTKHHPPNPGLHQSTRAHGAGLEGDEQSAVVEAPIPPEASGLLQRHQFGMAEGLLVSLAPVAAPAHCPSLAIHHHGGHGNLPLVAHQLSVPKQPLHPEELLCRPQTIHPRSVHNASA
jgi:hypothetical protein